MDDRSANDSNNISFKESIKQILEVPVLYAVIVGMIIATSNIFSSLKNIYLWLTVIIRLIIIPFITLGWFGY